jgi:hypothetical protein
MKTVVVLEIIYTFGSPKVFSFSDGFVTEDMEAAERHAARVKAVNKDGYPVY